LAQGSQGLFSVAKWDCLSKFCYKGLIRFEIKWLIFNRFSSNCTPFFHIIQAENFKKQRAEVEGESLPHQN
jgi:hypothetical protein